jgi:hypothetical protein
MFDIVEQLESLKWRARRAYDAKKIDSQTYGRICREVADLLKSISILDIRDV